MHGLYFATIIIPLMDYKNISPSRTIPQHMHINDKQRNLTTPDNGRDTANPLWSIQGFRALTEFWLED